MNGHVALIVTAAFIVWLFRRDMRLRRLPSRTLWIPGIWLTIVGSRAVSLWLATVGINVGGNDNIEGSPLDMAVFLGLMLAAAVVLVRRRFNWAVFVGNNKLLILIYAYLAVSACWSVIGFVSFKRAIKDFGHVLPALILLSEVNTFDAIRVVFVRVSYLLFPLSVVLIKYFPDVGRIKSRGGDALFSGVAMHKNELGALVLVLGMFLVVDLMEIKRKAETKYKKDRLIRYGMLCMGVWLLLTCDSMTSLACLVLGCVLLWATGYLVKMRDPTRILVRCMVVVAFLAIVEFGFGASEKLFEALGRNSTLTGRTEIWEMVKQTHTDPLLGCGFYSFWNTQGAMEISDIFLGTLNSAHNGLLEMYLDGGMIGLGLLVLLLATWGKKSVKRVLDGSLQSRLAVTYWLLAVIHNFSETGYFRFTPIWFTLLLLMIEYPRLNRGRPQRQFTSRGSGTFILDPRQSDRSQELASHCGGKQRSEHWINVCRT